MPAKPGTSKETTDTQISKNDNINIEKILQKIAKTQTIIGRNYVNNDQNSKNNNEKTRDRIILKDNPRGIKNLQIHTRQPIVIKRNTEQLEKLRRYRDELHELSEIIDMEINKTEVEWLSLTYEADKLKKERNQNEFDNEQKVTTIDEIDEQLRNCSELPQLDLRPTISNGTYSINKEEEFDTDSSES